MVTSDKLVLKSTASHPCSVFSSICQTQLQGEPRPPCVHQSNYNSANGNTQLNINCINLKPVHIIRIENQIAKVPSGARSILFFINNANIYQLILIMQNYFTLAKQGFIDKSEIRRFCKLILV